MSIFNHTYSFVRNTTILQVNEDADAEAIKAAQDAAIQERIDAAVNAATTGLKAKNEELLGKMAAAKDRVKQFDGLNPEELRALKDRLDADEDTTLIAQGKKNVLIEKYTERMRAQHQTELEAERERTKAEGQRADSWRSSVLDNQIRSVTGGLHKGAVEDALLLARNIFTLDAKGNAVQMDGDRPVLGKDGKSPFGPAEWIETMKELKPHWFPATMSGSGANGARDAGGAGSAKTISRAKFDVLSFSDQRKLAIEGTKIVD